MAERYRPASFTNVNEIFPVGKEIQYALPDAPGEISSFVCQGVASYYGAPCIIGDNNMILEINDDLKIVDNQGEYGFMFHPEDTRWVFRIKTLKSGKIKTYPPIWVGDLDVIQ